MQAVTLGYARGLAGIPGVSRNMMMATSKGRVLGVGGVFFRSPDPAKLGAWYQETLGLGVEAWGDTRGTSFAPADMPPNAFTVWSAFAKSTEYFGDPQQAFMINLVVDDLDLALARDLGRRLALLQQAFGGHKIGPCRLLAIACAQTQLRQSAYNQAADRVMRHWSCFRDLKRLATHF